MAIPRGSQEAFGRPGIEPRWTHGDKEGVGTAYSASSRLWFTMWHGYVTEIYYPTVDFPQVRDLQCLLTDGETFFHDELRHLQYRIKRLDNMLGYAVESEDAGHRYTLQKQVIADPHLPCLLEHIRVQRGAGYAERDFARLKLYLLCAPHLELGGLGNDAYVMRVAGRDVLVAHKGSTWLAMMATHPFSRCSVGYAGKSDGWTDLADGFQMDWQFDRAPDGNVALTGEIPMAETQEFTVGVAFGNRLSRVLTTLFQSLTVPFDSQRARAQEQWSRADHTLLPLHEQSQDDGTLYRASHQVVLAHEDKTYQGAIIASMSIPWGEAKSGDHLGGYHLVWVRDLVQAATALLAVGNRNTPLRSLIYLAINQLPDGSFPQNFWIDGRAYWQGIQLDEVAFPILLAHRLWRDNALGEFDPYPMVLAAGGFLARSGPATQEERWEEVSGYSPATLAANIAALICAANFARERGDEETAVLCEEHADFLEGNVENWTVTNNGTLVPGIRRHFVRITPARIGDPLPDTGVDDSIVTLNNRAPSQQSKFLARDIVDAGFLELVRYGVRRFDDPVIVDSLRVVDSILKVDTPYGRAWRRYNHDSYGQRYDGGPFEGYGHGAAWPLLAGERGHYELAAGGDVTSCIRWLEGFATPTGLLPEQVWDRADWPEKYLWQGRPTGASVPLLWAHAEYLKLLRSVRDGRVFDLVPEVAARYLGDRRCCRKLKVWSFLSPAAVVRPGDTLRILAEALFHLRWSLDGWQNVNDTPAKCTRLGFHYVDIAVPEQAREPVRFTFHWPEAGRWEGKDFAIGMAVDHA
jgi:glucoamylase